MPHHTSKPALLSVRHLHVYFGTRAVVRDISFDVQAGEKLALVGESGSGKTITALSLLRLAGDARITGQALLHGRDLLTLPEREMQAVRGGNVAMIFQEPMTALNPLMSIGAQVAEVVQLKQALSKAQAWQQAVELLASTGIAEPKQRAQAFPHQLSGGQRQRAMIAMALASRPQLLLADEPTTALDVTLRLQILELLNDLQRQTGMAIVIITHDLHLVRRFAKRAAIVEHGTVVECGNVEHLFATPRHPYTQKLLRSTPVREVQALQPQAPIVIRTERLRVAYPIPLSGLRGWFKKGEFVAVQSASLCLRQGQTLGVVGESGSGKSTLAQAILGLLPSQGLLNITHQTWHDPAMRNTPANQALRQLVQVVFQDPFSSLSPRMIVEDIVGEGLRIHAPHLTVVQRRRQVLRILNDVGLHEAQFPGLLQRYPHEFSGGQRQRLAMARALIVQPQVLVLDEPTSALDVTIQRQVLQLLQQLQRKQGLSYLLITHDMDVIRAMAHTVLVMRQGEIVESGNIDDVLQRPQHVYTKQLIQATL